MHEADDFLAYMQADRACSPLTAKTYRESIGSFETYFRSLDEGLGWDNLDADIVRAWMAARSARGRNPRTVAKDLSALRSLYKYLLRMGRVGTDPTRLLRSPKAHPPLPAFIKTGEMDRLLDGVQFPDTDEGARDRTILLTLYTTGLRVSELIGLDTTDIDLARGQLRVTGKRSKQRIVPFGAELAEALRTWLARRGGTGSGPHPVFTGAGGRRITYAAVRSLVVRYLSLVTTQKKKSPHVLRHTFATAMLSHGADLEAIKELLGHESIRTTEVYTHTTFDELKKEYEQAHPRA